MAFKFNPFTGNFDDVADVAEKVESTDSTTTDNAVVRWDGTNGLSVQNSGVTIDDSDNVIIPGNLTVNGTTTTINTATLDVEDTNITVNSGGNDASSEGAGLTVERTGTNGSFIYEDALTSKFKLGALGSEVEVADISSTQTLTNKTIDADNNTILDIADANISATAAITLSKLQSLTGNRALISNGSGVIEASAVSVTELQYLIGVTSDIQTQLNAKFESPLTTKGDLIVHNGTTEIRLPVGTDDQILVANSAVTAGVEWQTLNTTVVFDMETASGTASLLADKTYIVDTSSVAATLTLPAPSANTFVRVKDNGNALTNNITVNPNGAETIDGASSFVINSEYGSNTFVSDGTNWYIL